MSGRIDDISFSKLKEKRLSSQSEIVDFCSDENTTYIAVVSLPRDSIEEYVDMVWQELGMPEWALKRFLERRAGYRGNSAVENPHEQAYEDVHLHRIYQSHLSDSEAAQDRIDELVERVVSGEKISLVCYEEDGQSCHRHILVDIIRERVERRKECKFTLRA
jgi:hypothetical protein